MIKALYICSQVKRFSKICHLFSSAHEASKELRFVHTMQDSFCANSTKTIPGRASGAISVTERSRARQSRKWRVTYRITVPNTPLSMKTRSLLIAGNKWYTLIYILDQQKTKHLHTQANHHVLTFPAGITNADQNV